MEPLAGLFALGVAGVLLALPVVALVALVRANQALRELRELRETLTAPAPRGASPGTSARPVEPVPPRPPAEPLAPRPAASALPPRPATPTPSLEVAATPRGSGDFATSLGPKILVGAGGLAVIVFLGFFVRYAWENNWIGPTGRVLSGALFSLGLLAGGLRLMGREYRPLGQGLAAAGFAGLYITAFSAHAVYGLVPRSVAAGLMVTITVCAVLVSDRLEARLLAGLAWVGGYLAPVLLSTGEDRAVSLFAYLLLLGAGARWLERRRPWPETTLTAFAFTAFLYAAWFSEHFRPARLEVAAAGLLALTALFALGTDPKGGALRQGLLPGLAVVAGGLASVALAAQADRPASLLVVFGAQALLAAIAARRWAWATAASAVLAALAVLAWYDGFFRPGRGGEALALGVGIAGLYILVLAVEGFATGRELGVAGAVTHVAAAGLAWTVLDRVLGTSQPGLLGPAAVGLAAVHLGLGLAARRRGRDALRLRVTLGLSAVFLTLAVPAQLGLNGITLAWAVEGLLLLWLGVVQRSALTRGFGYGVLLLAVARLFLRHVPLHAGAFVPVLNASFGVWLALVAALGVASRLVRGVKQDEVGPLDRAASLVLAPLGLALLFGLLTAETRAAFDQAARSARSAGDAEAALRAVRQGGLAVSVLWTAFATALLAAGLGARSRPLFYAAYALFAFTAAKVVLRDLASLPTLYRMLSFLALGVLLLVGAWLNLRFRERLAAPGAPP